MRNPNLIGKLRACLPAPASTVLDELISVAEGRNTPVYLVGGPLRDLLLNRPSLDIDIDVEGDAMSLARELAKRLSESSTKPRSARPETLVGRAAATTFEPRVISHPAFLTATVRIPDHHLDLITARSETYARPGALPAVKPDTIRKDLLRRDFTINALALRLNSPRRGEILDPTGGLSDLDGRLVRALHERSFQDDATRILRAVRYAVRLDFSIEPSTLAWLKRDLGRLETISGARIHHEFARILGEDRPEDVLRHLHDLGALAAIHPALRFETEHAAAFARLRPDGRPSGRELNASGARAPYWPVLAWRLTEAEATGLARRLALTRSQRAAVEAIPALADLVSRRDAPQARLGSAHRLPAKRSAITEVLAPFPLPALWAFAALTDDSTVRDRLLDYLTKARHERTHLTGDDLLAMGVPKGPQLGDILRRLRAAKLDSETTSREDEKRLAGRLITKGDKAPLSS